MNNCITCDTLLPALEKELDRLRAQRRRAIQLADMLIKARNQSNVNDGDFWNECRVEVERFKATCE
jgi:hypothetical protein